MPRELPNDLGSQEIKKYLENLKISQNYSRGPQPSSQNENCKKPAKNTCKIEKLELDRNILPMNVDIQQDHIIPQNHTKNTRQKI